MRRLNLFELLDRTRTNVVRASKPFTYVWWPFIAVPILALLFIYADRISANRALILSVCGSTVTAFLVLFATLNNEKRSDYLNARKNAKTLAEIVDSVSNQITRIEDGQAFPIYYPENWLELYISCSIFLKYDYLEYLLFEFDIANKINACLQADNKEALGELLTYYRKSMTDWTSDFDITTIRLNLSRFASGSREDKPWKEDPWHLDFTDYFINHYTTHVIDLTVDILSKHNGSCKAHDAAEHVMARLRKDTDLVSGKHKFAVMQNKSVLNAISKVYFSLEHDDPFSFTWGMLHLKTTS